jgi:hypothetical protein
MSKPIYTPPSTTKPFRLTKKELRRTDSESGYTIVSRRQPSGCYLVAAVVAETGLLVHDGAYDVAVNKADVHRAVREVNRWFDKCGGSTAMTDASRHGHYKPREYNAPV